ncbi:src kinase-associated phosphoprotein 2 [Bufo gargarizans]|uniref:src kinase-associated phosphoprotein 2 n=1 Tax=Bufo gargarizans TaxID=30331 RepID=UPI001CF50C74|nr:src kinase-associated phosphoprotein 2 [Bufo gargarizans]
MTHLLPEDIRSIITELEAYLCDVLKGEALSKKAKDKKDVLIKKIKDIKLNYPQEFHDKGDSEDVEELEVFPRPPDASSLASDRDEEQPSEGNLHPPVAAQDLEVTKAGYLEKRRKDHSFFALEWQKRWCVLSYTTFYYYGSDKDKQQKGEFSLEGYSARINNTLRKDGKKDCCFEIYAPDKRVYQFAAATPKEAEEWVHAIQEDGETYDDVTQPSLIDDHEDIYEELPEESNDSLNVPEIPKPLKTISPALSSNAPGKETDYTNYYRGLWDCTGNHPDELSFKHGDVIYILNRDYNRYGWWVGEMKGSIGLVPKAYIMEMYDI